MNGAKMILIIDDETKVRKMYSDILTEEGFAVFTAPNADRAREILLGEKIDLVVLDIRMPGVDGGTINEVIRMFYKKARIIIASVFPLAEQKRIIEEADGYYDKSEGLDVLVEKIKEVLYAGDPKDDTCHRR